MNPMFYGTFAFLAFSSCLLAIGFLALRVLRKEEAAKRTAGFATSEPESRSRSAE